MTNEGNSKRTAIHTRFLRCCVAFAVLACASVGLISHSAAASSDTQATPLSEQQGRVLPDNEGAIAEILLHYDPVCAKELVPLYSDLFRQLEPDIRIKVVCPSKVAATEFFNRWGVAAAGNGRDLRIVNVNLPVSVWARDRCIAREGLDPQHPASCFVPARMRAYEVEKDNDRRAQMILWAAALGPQPLMSDLLLEGGNVVANRAQVFIGANIVKLNAEKFGRRKLSTELRRICGPDVVLVQDHQGATPWCHVDMYLTPIDASTMLVGSTDMANAILDDVPADRKQVDWMLTAPGMSDCDINASLDDVAEQMSQLNYAAYRLPIVADTIEEWMITYNNVLIDRRGDRRIVYMPIYHVPSLDSAAATVYRSLGFEVRRIDVSLVHKYGGAIRCIANVTQRRPLATPNRPGTATIGTIRQVKRPPQPDSTENRPTIKEARPQSPSQLTR